MNNKHKVSKCPSKTWQWGSMNDTRSLKPKQLNRLLSQSLYCLHLCCSCRNMSTLLSRPSYLCHVEQKCYGVVEVGVGAAGVDPEVPENRKQSGARQQDAGHQEDVPQDWTGRQTRTGDHVTSTPLLQFKFLFIGALLIFCFIGLQDNVTGNNSSYCFTGFHCRSIDQILQPTVKYLNNCWINGREIWWMKLRIILISSFIPCCSIYSHQQVIISTRRTLKTNDCFAVDPTGLCCIKKKSRLNADHFFSLFYICPVQPARIPKLLSVMRTERKIKCVTMKNVWNPDSQQATRSFPSPLSFLQTAIYK